MVVHSQEYIQHSRSREGKEAEEEEKDRMEPGMADAWFR